MKKPLPSRLLWRRRVQAPRLALVPSTLLAVGLVAGLVGCGSGGGGGENNPQPSPSSTPTATPTPTSTPTPTPTPNPTPTPVVVVVNPNAVTVSPLGTRQFAAYVANTIDSSVTWAVQEGASGGSVTSEGFYTAPLALGAVTLVVTSHADPSKTATATINVANQVALSPAAPTVTLADTIAFTASVPGATSQAVSWRILEAGGGAISPNGVYTAPRVAGSFHVVATSNEDSSKSAVVTVTVQSGGAQGGVQ